MRSATAAVLVIVSMCSLARATVTSASDAGLAFRARLLEAISKNRRQQVAVMFQYPTRVKVSGFDVPVANARELVRMYDLVFTRAMRCALEKPPSERGDAALLMGGGLVVAEKTAAGFRVTGMTVIGQ